MKSIIFTYTHIYVFICHHSSMIDALSAVRESGAKRTYYIFLFMKLLKRYLTDRSRKKSGENRSALRPTITVLI